MLFHYIFSSGLLMFTEEMRKLFLYFLLNCEFLFSLSSFLSVNVSDPYVEREREREGLFVI